MAFKKTSLIILGFTLTLLIASGMWVYSQKDKEDEAMKRILQSVSLSPNYATILSDQIKPGFTVYDVHKVMRGYSRIETVKYFDGFMEYYRYDLPTFMKIIPEGIQIEYDSNWNYKNFSFDS